MLDFEYILLLLLLVIGLGPLARRWDVPLPILLVLGGMLFAAAPLPVVQFNPDLIFLIFVPPLLYSGSLTSSARDLKRYQRAISRLAIGCVVVTILAVAVVAHLCVPVLPWAVCIVLGAMVSPPDAAVTLAIARKLGLPRSVVTILEGETLFNDLIAFITYRTAITAVVVGSFSWWKAIPHLVLGSLGGVLVGYLIARLIVFIRGFISEPRVANTLSLMTPFAAYLPAEWAQCSGVLAVVTTGLYLGRVGPRIVLAQTRLQAQQMWDVTLFILNGLIFTLIGIQLGAIIGEFMHHWQTMRFLQVLAISVTVILVRILWVIPAALVPTLIFRRFHEPRRNTQHPPWKNIAVVAWTGIRGGDTLVTALALPLTTHAGAAFPGRETVQTLAYGVILATLVVQGLSLRPLIRRLGFPRDDSEKLEENEARTRVAEAGVQRLMTMATQEKMPDSVVRQIRIHHHLRRHVRSGGEPQMENEGASILARHLLRINRDVLRTERDTLVTLRDTNVIADDVMRRLMRELDLEEVVMEREID
jgi:Na+/H+ antiporter